MGGIFGSFLMTALKSWLDKAIQDGTLAKILQDLLGKLLTGQIVTADHLVAEVEQHAQSLKA